MPDPREVLEQEAEVALDEARRRVREAIESATADVLANIGEYAGEELRAEALRSSRRADNRITRTQATREFGVTMSKLRTMERHGIVTARRRGGRIMLDRDEVRQALKARGELRK